MDQRITAITLGVRDMGASRAFYERLGWVASSDSTETVTFFQMDGFVFGLFGLGDLAKDAEITPDAFPIGGSTLAINMRSKADVDAALKEAEAAGAQILKPAQEVFWGGYSGYFADPDGHAWEVAFNPFWEITENGRILLPESH